MTTIIAILIATLLFGGRILYLFLLRKKTVDLLPVEAGPIADADEDFTAPVPVRVGEMKMDKSLQYFIVRNDCMKPLHINSNDIIGVQLFDDNFTVADVKKGDILLIFLDDNRFHGHKIRVMDYANNDTFHTFYFVGKQPHSSSEPHSFSTIRGIVKEINHPNPMAS